ncbi:TonB-dependent receptor domain-containing protein [Methylotenera sp. 1P/1]|uniref:TonB-dependent receptor domain-containing protein n=1 Tax=Methylotenera sp. 1P/1 TaxID=1131551 RepID=UPI00036C906B|nr:TonB-dependent receptor [Methylotenera sp. 1P/1]
MQLPRLKPKAISIAACSVSLMTALNAYAGALNTEIPVTVNLPAQPLAESLKQYAKQTGKNIVFDNSLAKGKLAPAIKGSYDESQTLKKILENTGLEANVEDNTIVIKRARVKVEKSENIQLDTINVRAKRFYEIGPLPGLGLTKEQIPGNVQSITAKEIKESHSLSITDLMNKKLQSVTVNDYQGNPFQMDVQYRGFTAGPQIGTPQGLSVFFDGIRVNEPFGDVVNWDMIPMNALAGVDVFPGSNPIFGLNTLGGAFTLKTKDGFNNAGVDAEVLYGSFNRKQLQVEGGWNNGTVGLFAAGNFFLEDGWRENSPSKVNQFFGKASYRGDKLDLNLSTLIVGTDLVGNGLIPSEEYARDRNAVFSSPDTTKNRLQQFQLSGAFQANDSFSVTGQVYRRNSKRHGIGADVFTDYDGETAARRLPGPGEEYTCLFNSNGLARANGVPDYYVIPTDASTGFDLYSTEFFSDSQGYTGMDAATFEAKYASFKNTPLSSEMLTAYQFMFNNYKNVYEAEFYNRGYGGTPDLSGQVLPEYNNELSFLGLFQAFLADNGHSRPFTTAGENSPSYGDEWFYKTDELGNITKNWVFISTPANNELCGAAQQSDRTGDSKGGSAYTYVKDDGSGNYAVVDGGFKGQSGVVEGTPTGIINDNNINQIVDGASIQFNWNLEHHKFMVGASIDAASAEYNNKSQLGFLDATRNVYLDPSQAHPQFDGAFSPVSNNDFSGTNTTKSIYFSETWTPVESWNFNASGRYNQTKTKNKIAARYGIRGNYPIGDLIAAPYYHDICNGDCATDPNRPEVNYRRLNITRPLDAAETEKFSFYSFNPSLGATWQAKENLNLFANLAKGTRTPSVIELGCAFDKTPIYKGPSTRTPAQLADPNNYVAKSISENRACTLPTTLSGDPFLPQIKATTYDIGARGTFTNLLGVEDLQWNLGAYQTDLKDDIYFVAVNGSGFFNSIGKTRRRGVEAGLSGKKNKWGFSLNYSLTDATFENEFTMLAADNSSATLIDGDRTGIIDVKPGSRMPGVPLHNLNATVSYDMTDKWSVGLTAVAHSESFVRGNENNEHKKGSIVRNVDVFNQATGVFERFYTQPTNNPGTVPGYATFNFQTSYKFNSEWTATMLVNNLLDKEYFSAGRLGINPFSPSIGGAIGPDGYNHNSFDWLTTNFIAPGAPRGVWFTLNWQFNPNAKPSF